MSGGKKDTRVSCIKSVQPSGVYKERPKAQSQWSGTPSQEERLFNSSGVEQNIVPFPQVKQIKSATKKSFLSEARRARWLKRRPQHTDQTSLRTSLIISVEKCDSEFAGKQLYFRPGGSSFCLCCRPIFFVGFLVFFLCLLLSQYTVYALYCQCFHLLDITAGATKHQII